MEISLNLVTLTHLAAVFAGFLSALVIIYYGSKSNTAIQPLAIAQLSISCGVFVSFLIVTQLAIKVPFLYRSGQIFALIFIPMIFLHVDFFTRKRTWKWYDLLHGIPLLIYLVDYGDVLLMSSAKKTELILQEMNDLGNWHQFRHSKYFVPGFHLAFRTVLLNAYWIAQVVVFLYWLRNLTTWTAENRAWRNWIVVLLGCQFFMWFPYYLNIFWLNQLTTYHIVNTFAIIWALLSCILLFFFPTILYSPQQIIQISEPTQGKVRVKTLRTDAEQHKLEEIMRSAESKLEGNKYFLKQGYSIHDFANDIQIPAYQISKSLNQFHNLGFVEYVNKKRIQYCVKKFDQGDWFNFTLEAVANECGFSNRNSFTKAFKKYMGSSPSEYRLSHSTNDS